MNFILDIPLPLRMAAIFLLGAIVGGQLNRGIYRLAWKKRPIGPWSPPHEKALPRSWFDRLPILGWLTLRREVEIHGAGFWARPMLIELFVGLIYAALYLWEIQGGLIADPPGVLSTTAAMLHAQYLAHIVLFSLMVVATFIDFDEKTIPDEITVYGTLVALLLAAMLPMSHLLVRAEPQVLGGLPGLDSLQLTMPWPTWLDGPRGLVCGLACFVGWCVAIMPTVWYTRGGLPKALNFLLASIFVRRASHKYWCLAAIGSLGIAGMWWWSDTYWHSLLSALVGMAFGGGLIWGVRIVGRRALGQEAMGFGDVTLMAMIGAFLGWQPALIVFFLAPFAALLIALTQKLLTGQSHIAFGPYLCLSAFALIVGWNPIWNRRAGHIFVDLGWFIPVAVVVCLILMGIMLAGWRFLRDEVLFPEKETQPNRPTKNRNTKHQGGKKRDKKGRKKR